MGQAFVKATYAGVYIMNESAPPVAIGWAETVAFAGDWLEVNCLHISARFPRNAFQPFVLGRHAYTDPRSARTQCSDVQ